MRALLLLLLLPLTSVAEESSVLAPVVVRGNKEDKTYLESQESITVLKDETISGAGREQSIQVLNAVPNVQVNKSGESFSIRGINSAGVTGYQKDSLASVIIDDIFQTDLALKAGTFDLWDVDRIEVYRGAQSTSQGVNSLSGNILLYHNQPKNYKEGMAKLGAGNFARKEMGAAVSQPLSQKLALRLYADKDWNHGYSKNITTNNDQWGKKNHDRAGFGLTQNLSEGETIAVDAKFNQTNDGGTYAQGADAFRHEVTEDEDAHSYTRNYQGKVQHTKEFSEHVSNEVTAAYSGSRQNNTSDGDGTPLNTAGVRFENHRDKYVSIENLFKYHNDRVKNVLGLHTHYFSLLDNYDFNLLYPLGASSTPISLQQDVKRSRSAVALFDSIFYKLTERQSLNIGLRAEYVENKYGTNVAARRVQNLGAGTNAAVDAYLASSIGPYDGDSSNVELLPKLGYLFDWRNHFFGLSYARAYRTGGLSINRRRAQAVAYDPEFTNNYELSYKYPGQDFTLSSNLFYIDWRAQQVQVQLTKDFFDTQVQNASKSQVLGGEFQGEYQIAANHSLVYGLGYVKTRFRDFIANGVDYAGKQFPFAAKFTSRAAYRVQPVKKLTLSPILRYVGTSFSNTENTRRAPSQFYLDLGAEYALGSFLTELYVNNMLDRKFLLVDGTPTSTTSPYQAAYHQTNTPRELGARVTYYW